MKDKLKAAIREFEFPLLVFPVLVTCIVALGFIFKCPCSVKEWWSAVALTIVLIWYRGKNKQVSAIVTAMFILALGLLWIATNVFVTSGWDDTLAYHQPAIRMLASGWNPVWQNTPEGIFNATGVAADLVNVWHIISMPKGVWYFCAVAYQFTNAHFNVLFPLMPLLYAACLYALYDTFRSYGRLLAICACAAMFCFVSVHHNTLIDGVVALGAIGLLVSMYDCIKSGKSNWVRLLVFSFWMAVAKQPALLHCILFWLIFIGSLYMGKRKIVWSKLFGIGVILFLLFSIASVAPYLTSTINYGSPFYPRYSGNEQKYPTRNITGDFFDRNEDAAAMGHIGAYVNAFVSAKIAKQYYVCKTGRKGFCPENVTWGQFGASRTVGSPTSTSFRLLYCLSIVLLCAFGGVAGRFFSTCIVIGTLAMPTEMIGYTRYTPFALSGCGIAILLLVDKISMARVKITMEILYATVLTAIVLPRLLMFCAVHFDQCHAIMMSLKCDPPSMMISSYKALEGKCAKGQKAVCGNLILLRKKVPSLAKSELIIDPTGVVEHPEKCQSYFDYGFKVLPDYPIERYCALRDIYRMANRKDRLLSYPMFVARTFFVSLPKSIWEVLHG